MLSFLIGENEIKI